MWLQCSYMSVQKHYIIIGNRRYGYTIRPARTVTTIVCRDANIETRIPNNKIPYVLADLPRIIEEQLQSLQEATQTQVLRFRVSEDEKSEIEHNAIEDGYSSVSAYLRDVALKRGANTQELRKD